MTFKILAAFALITSAIINVHATAADEASYPAGAVYNDSYFVAKKIQPISYNNLVIAHLSSRYREISTVDQAFADELQRFLGYTMPEFNRVYHARKVSGIRTEKESDTTIIEKFRPQVVGTSPTSEVFVDVLLSLDIVKNGRVATEYKDAAGGLQGTYTLDEYSVATGAPFANAEHATRIALNNSGYVINVPYVKTDFQREVYDAISDNRSVKKVYRGRLVLNISGCKRVAGYDKVTCAPKLTSYQLFAGDNVAERNLVKGAVVRLE